MIIDGYMPVDAKIATEEGVTFEYDLGFGKIIIRSKSLSGHDNPQFKLAMKGYIERQERRKDLGANVDEDLERQFLGILYDTGVVSWKTTIKSGGSPIEATRDSFIELLSSRACEKVVAVYIKDAQDETNFRPVTKEEDAKNSGAPSDGNSIGGAGKSSSST